MINSEIWLLNQLAKDRNWSNSTKTSYKTALNHYCKINNLSVIKLIKEAEKEEKIVSWKESKLRRRLVKFRALLFRDFNISSAKLYLSRVMTFYRTFDITVGQLPYISEKGVKKNSPISFKDLPDKEIIKKAINISKVDLRAIILFMSSSGCAKAETLNLTIKDFFTATSNYHAIDDNLFNSNFNPNYIDLIEKTIEQLLNQENIIPTFKIKRQKTDKFYYTFCSPEATEAILIYLLTRKDQLNFNKKLFKINQRYFFNKFAEINQILNLGKVGGRNRFRSHMLRKYHASRLAKSTIDKKTGKKEPGMSLHGIDALQGRTKTGSQNSYFFDDFESLREEYIQSLNKLTISNAADTTDYNNNNEFIQLKREINNKLNRLEELFSKI